MGYIRIFKQSRRRGVTWKRNKGEWKLVKSLKMFGDPHGVGWWEICEHFQRENIQCTYTMQLCRNHDAATFQRWLKKKRKREKRKKKDRKEKIPKKAFTSRPMNRRNRLEDFSFRFRGICRFNGEISEISDEPSEDVITI